MIDSYIKIKEKRKIVLLAEKLFLLSKKLINNDNIFIIDKVSSLLKVSIFFKTNYSKFYKKTVDELKTFKNYKT